MVQCKENGLLNGWILKILSDGPSSASGKGPQSTSKFAATTRPIVTRLLQHYLLQWDESFYC